MTNEEAINVLRSMKDKCILVFDKDRKDALDKAILHWRGCRRANDE